MSKSVNNFFESLTNSTNPQYAGQNKVDPMKTPHIPQSYLVGMNHPTTPQKPIGWQGIKTIFPNSFNPSGSSGSTGPTGSIFKK